MKSAARTFTFVLLVVAMLVALHWLPEVAFGDVSLRRVSILSDVWPDADAHVMESVKVALPAPPKAKRKLQDSLCDSTVVVDDRTPIAYTDSSVIDYSEGGMGGMHHFYEALERRNELGRPVRIAYFGDSFVEGDIMTCDLREMLQEKFGGSGVGWVDCSDQLNGFRQTVRYQASGLTEYEVVKHPFMYSKEGIAQRYFIPEEGAKMGYRGSKARRYINSWNQTSFFLRTAQSLVMKTTVGDTVLVDTIQGSEQVQSIVHRKSQMRSVKYEVCDVKPGTLLYGVALESQQGVVLDNFSMRGSAGKSLAKIPLSTLLDFARLRPYDLFVLHFGLNVANELSNAENYKSYIKQMEKVVNHLRTAYPQTSILVMSMPDRDQRTDAGIRTMKGVETLVAYQQVLAARTKVAYFNLFQAMGGRESMMKLVDMGVANKDYTHLSFSGGRGVARPIYEALIQGYDNR